MPTTKCVFNALFHLIDSLDKDCFKNREFVASKLYDKACEMCQFVYPQIDEQIKMLLDEYCDEEQDS